jgi:hypothetical protein
MLSPFLWLGADGLWHCVFSVNEKDNALAHASSVDLIAWGRQSYPVFTGSQNCLLPEFKYDAKTQQYLVSWQKETKQRFLPLRLKTLEAMVKSKKRWHRHA